MSDDCGKQIGPTRELLVTNMVSQICRGGSPGPVVSSDQTWKGVPGTLFLIGMCWSTTWETCMNGSGYGCIRLGDCACHMRKWVPTLV